MMEKARMEQVLQQAGVIPYSVINGIVRVLLVTSRDSGRWLIPKGFVDDGYSPLDAAVREAFEEAGVEGITETDTPLGFFTYFKRLKTGEDRPASVIVYLLRVEKQRKKWPEKKHRQCAWFTPEEASKLVREPGLAELLRRLENLTRH